MATELSKTQFCNEESVLCRGRPTYQGGMIDQTLFIIATMAQVALVLAIVLGADASVG
jgi:hypothetical protein